MWIGNALLVVLNLPMIGLWVKLLKVPYRLLFPAIMAFSAIGIYSVNNSSFEIYLTALFGVIGFIWIKLGCSPAPMLLGFVLGPMMEEHLRRAMLMSKGNPSVFVTRPISLGFLIATAADPGRHRAARRAQPPRRDRGIDPDQSRGIGRLRDKRRSADARPASLPRLRPAPPDPCGGIASSRRRRSLRARHAFIIQGLAGRS